MLVKLGSKFTDGHKMHTSLHVPKNLNEDYRNDSFTLSAQKQVEEVKYAYIRVCACFTLFYFINNSYVMLF